MPLPAEANGVPDRNNSGACDAGGMQSIFAVRLNLEKPPANLEKAAEFFAKEVMEEIVIGPPPRHLVAFTLGPARPMRWELEGAPSPPDDLIRALLEHEKAYAVGLVHPAAVPANVEADRAWVISCEDATRRLDVMIALRGSNERGGAEQAQMLSTRPSKKPPRWVGVPPEEVSLVQLEDRFTFGPAGDA